MRVGWFPRAGVVGYRPCVSCGRIRVGGPATLMSSRGHLSHTAQVALGTAVTVTRATQLFDRAGDEVTLDEVERFTI